MTGSAADKKIYNAVKAKRPVGKRSAAKFRAGIQWALGVSPPGAWGAKTEAAFVAIRDQHKMSSVKASLTQPAPPKKVKVSKPKLAVDGKFGPGTIKALQSFLKVSADGIYGPATKRALQKWVGTKQDGVVGPATIKALQKKVSAKPVDGIWGAGTTRALQTFLNKK